MKNVNWGMRMEYTGYSIFVVCFLVAFISIITENAWLMIPGIIGLVFGPYLSDIYDLLCPPKFNTDFMQKRNNYLKLDNEGDEFINLGIKNSIREGKDNVIIQFASEDEAIKSMKYYNQFFDCKILREKEFVDGSYFTQLLIRW